MSYLRTFACLLVFAATLFSCGNNETLSKDDPPFISYLYFSKQDD